MKLAGLPKFGENNFVCQINVKFHYLGGWWGWSGVVRCAITLLLYVNTSIWFYLFYLDIFQNVCIFPSC